MSGPGITAKVIADSVSPSGVRLTTLECRFPRIILAEVNTHRMLSRNSASSRAIPVARMIKQVVEDPFVPISWGKNKPGMQSTEEMGPGDSEVCTREWLKARMAALKTVQQLTDLGLHKQTANRLLEPWMWTTSVITATEWSNFFALRDHDDAEPHIMALAKSMRAAMERSTPAPLKVGEWHLPYVGAGHSVTPMCALAWSVARCARVSTLNHDGTQPDPLRDEALHDRLLAAGHMSPFEHQACPFAVDVRVEWSGNFRGWVQYRKTIAGENRG